MKLTGDTLAILRNFASINPNLVFKTDQTLRTISEAKTIMAKSEIVESFSREFGIYDLNEFLSVHALMDDASLELENSYVNLQGDRNQRIKYFYSEMGILTQPSKDIVMPSCEFTVVLSDDTLNQIRKVASVLGHNELSLRGDDGKITAVIMDSKDATANTYEIDIDTDNACKESFQFVVSIPNMKLLAGDYEVNISSKLISNWKNQNKNVEYFIALEKNSSYGV
tara:strand:+ start:272 stop:946 length:675 start_codon:yes stop_codon:yes gene_type:complete